MRGRSSLLLRGNEHFREGELRLRLLDMGLIPRTEVTLIKVAPMGDPIEIRVRGYELTLRVSDARNIEVSEVIEK